MRSACAPVVVCARVRGIVAAIKTVERERNEWGWGIVGRYDGWMDGWVNLE